MERFYTRSMLLDLAIILVAAKLAAELCERVNMPAVVGEEDPGPALGETVRYGCPVLAGVEVGGPRLDVEP